MAVRGESTVIGSRLHRTEWLIKEINESDHYMWVLTPLDVEHSY